MELFATFTATRNIDLKVMKAQNSRKVRSLKLEVIGEEFKHRKENSV
jgi:hypothetical protein